MRRQYTRVPDTPPAALAVILGILLIGTACGQSVPKPWKVVKAKVPAGVQLYALVTDQPLKAWLVVADLSRPELELRPLISKSKSGKETVSSLAKAAGAVVAINASYFKMTARPCEVVGWFVLDGKRLSAPTSFATHRNVRFSVARSALMWKRGGALRMGWVRDQGGRAVELERPIPNKNLEPAVGDRAKVPGKPVADVLHAVSAGPMLVRNGKVAVTNDEEMLFAGRDDRHPRTVVGLAGSKVFLLVIDGRQKGVSRGSTLLQAGRLMRDWGVQSAMNMDGGGSSTLVVAGSLVNLPLGRKLQRPVPTGLGILHRRK